MDSAHCGRGKKAYFAFHLTINHMNHMWIDLLLLWRHECINYSSRFFQPYWGSRRERVMGGQWHGRRVMFSWCLITKLRCEQKRHATLFVSYWLIWHCQLALYYHQRFRWTEMMVLFSQMFVLNSNHLYYCILLLWKPKNKIMI